MEKKQIMFDGGPLHNTFREVPKDVNYFYYYEQPESTKLNLKTTNKIADIAEPIRRQYKGTSTKYNGIQVFVWIDLKPTENESDNEGTEVS